MLRINILKLYLNIITHLSVKNTPAQPAKGNISGDINAKINLEIEGGT